MNRSDPRSKLCLIGNGSREWLTDIGHGPSVTMVLTMKIHTIVVGRLQTNCYILQSGAEAMIVDPGDEPERIVRFIKDINAKTARIVATHTHFDHVLGVDGSGKQPRLCS